MKFGTGWLAAHRVPRPARYVVVGGATTCSYLALFGLLLALGMNYLLALLVAQVVTVASAFSAYRRWVFGPGSHWARDLLRFVSVWCGGAVLGVLATATLVELAGWHPMMAQATSVVAISVTSYLGHRWFSFRPVSTIEHVRATDLTY